MDVHHWDKIKDLFGEALDLDPKERVAFVNSLDEAVRPEVEKLIASHEKAVGFIETPAAFEYDTGIETDEQIGAEIDHYRIVEQIGSGGMGAVYLAEHHADGIDHRVAIKLIKRGMDTGIVLKRFVQERQILAGLEHPNIARFLDGGSTSDGRPYVVMEYVEGLPIRRYAEENALSINEILELFRKVCAAVSFAHQNLIVHRDLKPSNILVGENGEPKLLDFGIAKLLNPDWSADTAEATATMFRVMTPEYASPEQIRGATVTTASDVYSLGVVLYELLTGKRPFKIDSHSPDEIARQVLTVDPPRPSSVIEQDSPSVNATDADKSRKTKPDHLKFEILDLRSRSRLLRGDLDNIILKALQKEPERRYASVQEFSEDIRRHLDGLPVSATADTFSYRAAKFVRRHAAGVGAAVAVGVILIAATSVTAYQAYRAERERYRAEQRFNDVRRLTNSFMFDFHDSIKDLAGSTAARALVVKKALEYLEILATENPSDPSLRYELASAFFKIGRIQSSSSDASLGDSTAAMRNLGRARDIFEPLVASDPSNTMYLEALGTTYLDITIVAAQRGDVEDMVVASGRATELYEKLIEIEPTRNDLKATVSDAYKNRGDYVSSRGDLEGALSFYRKASESARTVLTITPDNDHALSRVLVADEAVAATLGNPNYTNLGRVSEATELYRHMLAISKRRIERSPDDRKARANHAYFLENLGLLLGQSGDWASALEHHDEALAIQKPFADADKDNAVAHWRMADMLTDRGEALSKLGRFFESFAAHRQAISIYEAILVKDPDNGQMHVNYARSLQRYADALARSDRLEVARTHYEKAIAINSPMADEDPENMDIRWALASDHAKLGRLHLAAAAKGDGKQEHLAAAKQNLEVSLKIYEVMRDHGLAIKPILDALKDLDRELAECNKMQTS